MAKIWVTFLFFLSLTFFASTNIFSCDFEPLLNNDDKFCRGDLHVIYPNMGDVSCVFIPNCFKYPQSLSKVWGAPMIRSADAKPENLYTLIMVDPDPVLRFWRHWLVTHIPGEKLQEGGPVTGNVVSQYHRPNPPIHTGYHRYLFILYEQHPQVHPTLLQNERPLASWNISTFVRRSKIVLVATTLFMVRNPHL
ncbi:phosphatidylethanolamine-binding protein 4-like [Hyperolius riggenbachi]|uniref:phosphatidylethanolamine-binding protein 4-like n=1 Tax=Hyperolius riggenbachi TaxID=752182 RepID=UPI0035A39941